MKYIVYQTTNLINNKIYIGVHKIKNNNLDDGYLGCGVYKTRKRSYDIKLTMFQKAVVKYGPENFKRETLKEFDSKYLAYKYESVLVTLEFSQLDSNYNMKPGGKGGFPNKQKKKLTKKKKSSMKAK